MSNLPLARSRAHAVAATAVAAALPLLAALTALAAAGGEAGAQQPRRAVFAGAGATLVLEAPDDDLVHFEYAPAAPGAAAPRRDAPIGTSPMVLRTDYPGARAFTATTGGIETADVRVAVAPGTLCFTVTEKARARTLTTVCPADLAGAGRGLTLARSGARHVYGLGEQFTVPGRTDGDWLGRERTPGSAFGNRMVNFEGGQVGNALFPIMYALGEGHHNWALFLDDLYAQTWDFRADPWRVRTRGGAGVPLRGYVLTGAGLPDLRHDYLELVGTPPVPPRQAFGLWVSEYGFDHWHELETRLASLRADSVPVDGFVLDVQWFGGLVTGSDESPMGTVSWDLKKFPDPRGHLARLRAEQGVGVIPIEEPYVSRAIPEHDTLARRGFMPRTRADGPPIYLGANPWWGKGGMLDFTDPAAGAFWHDWKRQPLVDVGVAGHWTDLGEPEAYDSAAWYHGVVPGRHGQADVHNAYNLQWAASIAEGYRRHQVARRPFLLSRSGTSGIQRHGAAMWSGDIGANFASLAAHQNAQLHMALSGMDYFGSDIGGFHRGRIPADSLDELYTRWFAAGTLLEVPVRVHTENLCNCKETAPNRIGHVPSNLAALRLRYSLLPYYYALAHRARLHGEAVVAPLVLYHQDDPAVRTIGDEKLVGRDLLVALSTRAGQRRRDVYLPRGTWYDFHSHARHEGGRTLRDVALEQGGLFRLPLYARAGAIVPRMHVDARTANGLGRRTDGTTRDELIVRVYPDAQPSAFTLYEDDGETVAYQTGALATTALAQRTAGGTTTVTVAARQGTYAGAPAARAQLVELVAGRGRVGAVRVDGAALARHATRAAFDAAASGWLDAGDGLVLARVAARPVGRATTFEFAAR